MTKEATDLGWTIFTFVFGFGSASAISIVLVALAVRFWRAINDDTDTEAKNG